MSQTGSYSRPQTCETLSPDIQNQTQSQPSKRRWFLLIITTFILAIILYWQINIHNSQTPNPSSPSPATTTEIWMNQGIMAMQSHNYPLAITAFSQQIAQQTHIASAYSNRCLAYLQIQAYENAIADCNQAIKLNPNNTEAYLNRGISYYQIGDYQQALNNTQQVIIRHPGDFRAYYNRALANAALGNYPQTIHDYHIALISFTCHPSHHPSLLADIYNDLGLAYFQLHNLNSAIDQFNLAIRTYPIHEFAHFNRGCSCGKQGNYRDAIRDFSQVVRINPSNTNAYVNRGMAYHYLGYESAAIADLKTAIQQFSTQNNQIAYQKTLNLLKFVQTQIHSFSQIG